MKITSLTILSLLFFSFKVSSQNCSIIGSWKNTGYEVDGKLKGVDDSTHVYLSFYSDGKMQSSWISNKEVTKPNNFIGSGTYEFDGEKVLRLEYLNQNVQKVKVISCSDSSLVLEFNLIEIGRTRNFYERAEQMPYVIVPEASTEVISPAEKVNNAIFYLVSESNPEKKFKLKDSSDLRFTYSRESPFFPKAKENVLLDGAILDVDSLGLKVEVDYFYAEAEVDQDSCTIRMNVDYEVAEGQITEIPLNQLEWIEYTSPAASKGQMIGSAMIIVGIYSFLIATPIASINSKKGTFDREKAYLVGGASLGLVALSIPVFALSPKKRFKINKDVFCDDQEYWRIVKGE